MGDRSDSNSVPSNGVPSNSVPSNSVPSNSVPSNSVPSNSVPVNSVPVTGAQVTGVPVTGGSIGVLSDDDLADLALGAAPHDPFDVDATPFGSDISAGAPLLPDWYMPVPQSSASSRTPRRTFTVGLIIAALIAVNGAGLCVTYGIPEIAW